jgi:hypothetical protein
MLFVGFSLAGVRWAFEMGKEVGHERGYKEANQFWTTRQQQIYHVCDAQERYVMIEDIKAINLNAADPPWTLETNGYHYIFVPRKPPRSR